jgi:hypothetical protein
MGRERELKEGGSVDHGADDSGGGEGKGRPRYRRRLERLVASTAAFNGHHGGDGLRFVVGLIRNNLLCRPKSAIRTL